MRKLNITSIIISAVTVVGFVLWRFVIAFPDWLVRVLGIFMLVSIFTMVYSTIKIKMSKK